MDHSRRSPDHIPVLIAATEYEYAFFTQAGPISVEPAEMCCGEMLANHLGEALGPFTRSLTQGLQTFRGGGWEVVSHNMILARDSVLMVFLIRRQRNSGAEA